MVRCDSLHCISYLVSFDLLISLSDSCVIFYSVGGLQTFQEYHYVENVQYYIECSRYFLDWKLWWHWHKILSSSKYQLPSSGITSYHYWGLCVCVFSLSDAPRKSRPNHAPWVVRQPGVGPQWPGGRGVAFSGQTSYFTDITVTLSQSVTGRQVTDITWRSVGSHPAFCLNRSSQKANMTPEKNAWEFDCDCDNHPTGTSTKCCPNNQCSHTFNTNVQNINIFWSDTMHQHAQGYGAD